LNFCLVPRKLRPDPPEEVQKERQHPVASTSFLMRLLAVTVSVRCYCYCYFMNDALVLRDMATQQGLIDQVQILRNLHIYQNSNNNLCTTDYVMRNGFRSSRGRIYTRPSAVAPKLQHMPHTSSSPPMPKSSFSGKVKFSCLSCK